MSAAKEAALETIRSVTSAGHLDIEDHEVDLKAITSTPIGLEDVGTALTLGQKDLIVRRLGFGGLLSLNDLPLTATFMIEKIEKLSIAESVSILKQSVIDFEGDVNIPLPEYDFFVLLVNSIPEHFDEKLPEGTVKDKLEEKYGSYDTEVKSASEVSSSIEAEESKIYDPYRLVDWELQTRLEAALIVYYSPYQEVRAVTDPYDDPTIPVETLRVYFLGLCWTCIISFVNQFFQDRLPGITLSSGVVQTLLYPCGIALEKIVPKWKVKIWRYEIDFNPGPWTYKEQMLTTLMFSVAASPSYVSWNITVQRLPLYYGNTWVTKGYQVLLLLATNFMGFGFAGLIRKFVVYPPYAVWPTILPTLALNRALLTPEKKERINGWSISRYKFFWIVAGASFFYFWIPDYLFQAVSMFNWMTWIKPDNANLAVITGGQLGLGLNPVATFDWTMVSNSPLVSPFYTTVNNYIGMFLSFFFIIGVWYSNYKWTGYLPINSNRLFNNKGEPFRVQSVVDEKTLFSQEKYDQYGPPFYTAGNLVVYGSFFAAYPFIFVHEIAMSYKPTWKALKGLYASLRHFNRSTFEGFDDPHSVMMRKYKEVPEWAFVIVLLLSIVFAIIVVKIYPQDTPVWTIFFALGINFVFLVPLATLYSVTNFSIGLNVLVELITGYALPGNGLALMFVKALGYNIDGQAENYITDQKMGHYSKLPPRAMFRIQMLGVFVGTFINMAALDWKLTHIADYCSPKQPDKFTCPSSNTYFSASVIWGVIGPKRVFDGLYPILKYCFLIGFLLAIPCAAIKLYGPQRYVKFFQPSVIIGGMLQWAPTNLAYYTPGLYFAIASMWYLQTRYVQFWSKYNYLFNAALTAGVAFSGLIIFFAVQYHPKNITWWGNDVPYAGIDGDGTYAWKNVSLAEGGYFGPRQGHYP